jgi:hypothetical protein
LTKEHEVEHPVPWRALHDESNKDFDSWVVDANGGLVLSTHRRAAARIVALTKVAAEAHTYILTGCRTGLTDALAELEALP